MRGPMGEWSAERILLVDLSDGEPTEFAERGVRARQAAEAARILGVDRLRASAFRIGSCWILL